MQKSVSFSPLICCLVFGFVFGLVGCGDESQSEADPWSYAGNDVSTGGGIPSSSDDVSGEPDLSGDILDDISISDGGGEPGLSDTQFPAPPDDVQNDGSEVWVADVMDSNSDILLPDVETSNPSPDTEDPPVEDVVTEEDSQDGTLDVGGDNPPGSVCGDGNCEGAETTENCPSDCADHCPNLAWNCEACAAGESCVLGRCAPTAVVLTSSDMVPSFSCPPGYSLAGRWQAADGVEDGYVDALDHQGFKVDDGWAYLCSAAPSEVYLSVAGNDCGQASPLCGAGKGAFHVGAGCGNGAHGVDRDGNAIDSGWLKLCVEGAHLVKIEVMSDDCGNVLPAGCGSWSNRGQWHTYPGGCGGGVTGNGITGVQEIESGWMGLCVDTDRQPPTDPSTLGGKALFGYQGWFRAPGDGAGGSWLHWFSGGGAAASNANVDLWPDLSEFDADELFPTDMVMNDGSPAMVFSSFKEKTVIRHFKWMEDAGIDGVFLQRFVSSIQNPNLFMFRNQVTTNICMGATTHGRAFAMMYDISGSDEETFVQEIIDDWTFMVDEMGVTDSSAYLHQDGKPVLAIWGLGFTDRPGTVDQALALIDYFQNQAPEPYRAYVIGGVPYYWRTSNTDSKPNYGAVYEAFDAISPWSVGRYNSEGGFNTLFANVAQGDKVQTDIQGQDYIPVIWPGFSWANLKDLPSELNAIPRNGGTFYWHQFKSVHALDPLFVYVAMFDEVDEATAMFKAATHAGAVPTTGQFLHLGQDGWGLPSDWYLRLGGASSKAMFDQFNPFGDLPYDP